MWLKHGRSIPHSVEVPPKALSSGSQAEIPQKSETSACSLSQKQAEHVA